MEGEEINLLGKGKKDGKDVVVVGEAVIRLDDASKFGLLERKMKKVVARYPGYEVIPILVTHYATENMVQGAKESGVLVIQSFEWA
jgi:hypothetical protein